MVVHKVLKTGEIYECIEKKCKWKEEVPADKLKANKETPTEKVKKEDVKKS
jgi:hypothetical protein